jgi:LytS/YehU family sensor histidine kinase
MCAFLKTIYHLTVVENSFDFFFTELYGYFKSMNIFGFSLAFSYLVLSLGPDKRMSITRISMIGLASFVISFPFIYITGTPWNESSLHPFLQVSIYSLSTLIFSAWAIMLIIYVQSRESQPKFQMLKQQVAEHSIEREKVEMEMQLLQAQIEPHFFYNTLANLHNLIDLDAERAKKLLEELTEYLRSTVPQYRRKYIKVDDEMEMIRRYLNIQKIRFGDKLNYTISVPKALLNHPILPMSVLTLVENSIKHGIEKQKANGLIHITGKINNKNMLVMVVKDNAGLMTNANYGTGISNLLARMKVTYGSEAAFSLSCEPNNETIATIEVPSNG